MMTTRDTTFHFDGDCSERRIRVNGELTHLCISDFREVLRERLEKDREVTCFILDLSECPFVDSGCMGMMVEFKKELDHRNCLLRVENVQRYVDESMRRIGLHCILSITKKRNTK